MKKSTSSLQDWGDIILPPDYFKSILIGSKDPEELIEKNMKEKQQIEFVWQYKDSSRFWWEITMWKDVDEIIDEDRYAHWGWNCQLPTTKVVGLRSNAQREIY